MPAIPALTLSPGNVNIDTIYQDSIYGPAATPDTFEILNGGLDEAGNWTGGDNSLPAWAVQEGTFVRYWSTGFTRWEYYYERQLSSDSNVNNRLTTAGLCLEAYIPWDCTIWYGYQAWCLQDATQWDHDNNGVGLTQEYWDIRFNIDGAVNNSMYAKLPHTRTTQDDPTTTPTHDPGYSQENRWKWVAKMSVKTGKQRGYLKLRTSAWASIEPETIAKTKMPTGFIWALALRT